MKSNVKTSADIPCGETNQNNESPKYIKKRRLEKNKKKKKKLWLFGEQSEKIPMQMSSNRARHPVLRIFPFFFLPISLVEKET